MEGSGVSRPNGRQGTDRVPCPLLSGNMILREAERKLHENQEQNVKNSTAYTMAVLFNCIAESESDLMVDPYLNALSSTA